MTDSYDFHLRPITLRGKQFLAVKHSCDQYLFLIDYSDRVKAMVTLKERIAKTFPHLDRPHFQSTISLNDYHHNIVRTDLSTQLIQKQLTEMLKKTTLEKLEHVYNNTANYSYKATPQDVVDKKPAALAALEAHLEHKRRQTENPKFKVGDLVKVQHIKDFNRIEIKAIYKSGSMGKWKYNYDVEIFYKDEDYATGYPDKFDQAYLKKTPDNAIPWLYPRDEPFDFSCVEPTEDVEPAESEDDELTETDEED